MQLKYVFSEAGIGLRRNLSMTIALVVTIFVSLTLVGTGLLLRAQARHAEDTWGSQLQITVYMCNKNSQTPNCAGGEVTTPQRQAIEQVLKTNPEVKSVEYVSKESAYQDLKKLQQSQGDSQDADLFKTVTVDDMNQSFRVTLKDPQKYQKVREAVSGMDGVNSVLDLHTLLEPLYRVLLYLKWGSFGFAGFLLLAAILEVGNTIRLAAAARRREIAIMRLVGAGSLSIQLPFLIETMVAAVIGLALSSGALLLGTWRFVYGTLRKSNVVVWVSYADALNAIMWMSIIGLSLTLVTTLLMTRKYLKV